MTTTPTNDRAVQVLTAIARAMTRPPVPAALSHFPSLRAQTARANSDFAGAVEAVDLAITWFKAKLQDNADAAPAYALPSDHAPFRQIVPLALEGSQRATRKLLAATHPADRATTLEQVERIRVDSGDFTDLGTATRQCIDSMIESSYQVCRLDPRTFNYAFLESVVSFASGAPPSLSTQLHSEEIQKAIDDFAKSKGRKKRVAAFACDDHSSFDDRVSFLADLLAANVRCRKALQSGFKFCSDLVHLGFASDAALGTTRAGQVILGIAEDHYTASAENLAEVKLSLLRLCAESYLHFFIAAIGTSMRAMLADPAGGLALLAKASAWLASSPGLEDRVAFEFVADSLMASDRTIDIQCGRCGGEFAWNAPHHRWDCYCRGCGCRYEIIVVADAVDYILSAEGESLVLGSDAPAIAQLAGPLREKLGRLRARQVPPRKSEAMAFLHITDLERVDEQTLAVEPLCTSRPAMDAKFQLIGFVAVKALARCAQMQLMCACGQVVPYATASKDALVQCGHCRRVIGVFGVAGDGTQVALTTPEGKPQFAPIHGARSPRLRIADGQPPEDVVLPLAEAGTALRILTVPQ